jgi:hypothetical protein
VSHPRLQTLLTSGELNPRGPAPLPCRQPGTRPPPTDQRPPHVASATAVGAFAHPGTAAAALRWWIAPSRAWGVCSSRAIGYVRLQLALMQSLVGII